MPKESKFVSGDEWRESVANRQVRGGHILRSSERIISPTTQIIDGKPMKAIDLGHALEAADPRSSDRFGLMKTKGRIIGGR